MASRLCTGWASVCTKIRICYSIPVTGKTRNRTPKGRKKIKNMKNGIKYVVASLSTSAMIAPLLAFGYVAPQGTPSVPATPPALTNLSNFKIFLCTVVFSWFFTFLIVLAAIFALVAAYKYLTAGGDPEKVKAASNILIYCAIAVVAALFARGLPLLVNSLIGGTALGTTVSC